MQYFNRLNNKIVNHMDVLLKISQDMIVYLYVVIITDPYNF